VTLDGRQPRLRATADGQPVAAFSGKVQGLLRYQTVAAADPAAPRPEVPAMLPRPLARRTRRLSALPISVRVDDLLDLVRGRVRYDTSAATAQKHRTALAAGQGFIRRTLEIGAGDCDVLNGLLTALLQAAGVPARLAVGYQGDRGQVLPWLHAWAEYRDDRGRWQVADATETESDEPLAAGSTAVVRRSRRAGPAAAAPAAAPEGEPAADLPEVEVAVAAPAVAAAARPPAAPGSAPSAAPAAADSWLDTWPARLLPPLVLLGLLGAAIALRTRRRFSLDSRADLSKLLQGVLEQPGAFRRVDALFLRPLVPLADGRAISLLRARQLASKGRLFCTRDRPPLARRAMRAGATVLDDRLDEGRTVARALAAVDLDRWAEMIDACVEDPLLEGVNRILRKQGEEWSVRASTRVSTGVAAIDLHPLGGQLTGLHGTRLVLVDAHAPWLAEAAEQFGSRTQAAYFMVLDQLAGRLSLPEARREPLLGEVAQQVILEAFA
jgi:hypothetical protein